MKTTSTKLIVSIVAVLAVIGGVFTYALRGSHQVVANAIDQQAAASNTTSSPIADNNPADTNTNKYKDGTYSAVGHYYSPGGPDDLNVSLTLKNDIITDVTVTSGANDPRSARYQQMFISGYKSLVVGKNIDSVSLDRVSGSSLTPGGFNDALSQIKTQARA